MKSIKNINNIHFIGIGGISMMGIALYLKQLGKNISGSDIGKQPSIEKLKSSGIKVYEEHLASNVKNVDLVVYSGAIKIDNIERSYAEANNIPCIERGNFLGLLCDNFDDVIAICGTHGKTTTTAFCGYLFNTALCVPTIHIGGVSTNLKSNFIIGKKDYFITEACEYRKSFLHIHPTTSIITNIDKEHMDCYKNMEELNNAFKQFAHQTKKLMIYCGDNLEKDFFYGYNNKAISYGFNQNNDYYIVVNKIYKNFKIKFSIYKDKSLFLTTSTKLFGIYNLLNILAGVILAKEYNIELNTIKYCIENFQGVERRFQFIKNIGKSKVYCDYAHHPNEIKSLINSAKILNYEKIIAIFQPHTFSRTITLFDDFVKVLCIPDELYLIPTYSAREIDIIGGTSIDLYNAIKKIHPKTYFYDNKSELIKAMKNYKNSKNLILLIGAGDINNLL